VENGQKGNDYERNGNVGNGEMGNGHVETATWEDTWSAAVVFKFQAKGTSLHQVAWNDRTTHFGPSIAGRDLTRGASFARAKETKRKRDKKLIST